MQSQIKGFEMKFNAEPTNNMIAYQSDNVKRVTLVGWIGNLYPSSLSIKVLGKTF